MNFLNDPDRVKVLKFIIAINFSAGLLNLSIVAWHFSNGVWLGVINLCAAIFSFYMAHKCFKRYPETKRNQEERILKILKGKYT